MLLNFSFCTVLIKWFLEIFFWKLWKFVKLIFPGLRLLKTATWFWVCYPEYHRCRILKTFWRGMIGGDWRWAWLWIWFTFFWCCRALSPTGIILKLTQLFFFFLKVLGSAFNFKIRRFLRKQRFLSWNLFFFPIRGSPY